MINYGILHAILDEARNNIDNQQITKPPNITKSLLTMP